MEDQQPDPGALTESPDPDEIVEIGEDASEDEATEEAEATEATENAEEPAPASAPLSKRGSGRALRVAVAAAAAAFVAAAGFAGAAVQPYLTDRAEVAVKLQVTKTAVAAITTLWTYTPDNMDGLADRASVYLSGDLKAQYRKLIDTIVETNKQAKVTNSTEITGAAVESLQGSEATVLVYMNTSGTSDAQKGLPSLKYLTYRLLMKRDNNRWVVTKMPTVTSLSLTPRL